MTSICSCRFLSSVGSVFDFYRFPSAAKMLWIMVLRFAGSQDFHLAVPIQHDGSEDVKADMMQRIAAPMIGGMVSSTILTLIVIPVLYFIWRGAVISPSEQNAVEETAPNEVN